MIGILLVIAALLIVGATVAGGVIALDQQRHRIADDENRVLPGTPTRAPLSWSHADEPEARMHRRLRAAMIELRSPGTGDADRDTEAGALVRERLQRSALAIDDHLVEISALAPESRESALGPAEAAVTRLEGAVTDYRTVTTGSDPEAMASGLAALSGELARIEEIPRGPGAEGTA